MYVSVKISKGVFLAQKINEASVLRDSAELKISIESHANRLMQPTAERAHI